MARHLCEMESVYAEALDCCIGGRNQIWHRFNQRKGQLPRHALPQRNHSTVCCWHASETHAFSAANKESLRLRWAIWPAELYCGKYRHVIRRDVN